MRLFNMIGYKLYKDNEDGTAHIIRITGMRKPFKITNTTPDPSEIIIYDYDTNESKKVRVDSLSEYHPLKPDGILTSSIVRVKDKDGKICDDVIVSAIKYINLEFKINPMPFAVCRQNITDVFYNIISTNEDDMLAGLAINQDDCPSNFDFGIMFACNEVLYSDYINFYRSDLLEDIYPMLNMKKYDEVLRKLYEEHIKYCGATEYLFKSEHKGWCKDLKTLLSQNNFQNDINEMLGITDVAFKISDYLVDKELPGEDNQTYQVLSDDLKCWLSSIYKVSIGEANVMKFDHDINLADFNDNRYLLLRDIDNILYLVVYTVDGEYLEADLEAKAKEMDFSTKFKIEFYNKYNRDNKN